MKAFINGKIYDPNETPIAIILGKQDKENIKNMLPSCTVYGAFPAKMPVKAKDKIMHEAKKHSYKE